MRSLRAASGPTIWASWPSTQSRRHGQFRLAHVRFRSEHASACDHIVWNRRGFKRQRRRQILLLSAGLRNTRPGEAFANSAQGTLRVLDRPCQDNRPVAVYSPMVDIVAPVVLMASPASL